MVDRLKDTVALVTGASSGIGEATARSLAAQGAKVALVARRVERIEKLAQEIAGHGHTALAIEADVTDQQQAIDAVDRLFENSDGRALAVGTPIQRFWRDAHAGRVHAINDPERALSIFGRGEFGLPTNDAMV